MSTSIPVALWIGTVKYIRYTPFCALNSKMGDATPLTENLLLVYHEELPSETIEYITNKFPEAEFTFYRAKLGEDPPKGQHLP